MKINKATKLAVSAKNHAVKAKSPGSKPAVKASKATKKAGKASKPVKGKLTSKTVMVALISGARGIAARSVNVYKYATGETEIAAIQNNLGLAEKNAVPCAIIGGKLVGEKDGRIQLAGYVNGRNTGASVELITEKEFSKRSLPCFVHWKADDAGINGRYIGNPNVKGICAVAVVYGSHTYYWQMELDANSNNKHERGVLKPLGNQPLKATK